MSSKQEKILSSFLNRIERDNICSLPYNNDNDTQIFEATQTRNKRKFTELVESKSPFHAANPLKEV